jgi:hypothetical protein
MQKVSTRPEGGVSLIARLWEWAVLGEIRDCPVGICGSEQAAVAALSTALVAAGRPARGHISRATLIRPVHEGPSYVREPPERTAVYDGSVILWD